MGLFKRISEFLSGSSHKTNYTFNDNDRDKAVAARKAINETRELEERLKREEIQLEHLAKKEELLTRIDEAKVRREELFAPDEEDEPQDNSEDSMLMSLLSTVIMKQQTPTSAPSSNTPSSGMPPNANPSQGAEVSYSDEQIKEHIAQIPKAQLKLAKKIPDMELRRRIKIEVPDADADSVERIFRLIKS